MLLLNAERMQPCKEFYWTLRDFHNGDMIIIPVSCAVIVFFYGKLEANTRKAEILFLQKWAFDFSQLLPWLWLMSDSPPEIAPSFRSDKSTLHEMF